MWTKLSAILLLFLFLTFGCITHSVIVNNKLKKGSSLTVEAPSDFWSRFFTDSSILQPTSLLAIMNTGKGNRQASYIYLQSYSKGERKIYNISTIQKDSNVQIIQINAKEPEGENPLHTVMFYNKRLVNGNQLTPISTSSYLFSFDVSDSIFYNGKMNSSSRFTFNISKSKNFTLDKSLDVLSGELRNDSNGNFVRYLIVDDPNEKWELLHICSFMTFLDDEKKRVPYRKECHAEALKKCGGNILTDTTDFENWFLAKPIICRYSCAN
jgi:hypothetical protein